MSEEQGIKRDDELTATEQEAAADQTATEDYSLAPDEQVDASEEAIEDAVADEESEGGPVQPDESPVAQQVDSEVAADQAAAADEVAEGGPVQPDDSPVARKVTALEDEDEEAVEDEISEGGPVSADEDADDDAEDDSDDEDEDDTEGEDDDSDEEKPAGPVARERSSSSAEDSLIEEADAAADYLEELLDIADLDGDIDTYSEGDRAHVSVVTVSVKQNGRDGEVLEALQELSRLAVLTTTGHRSRLMLDVAGHREKRRKELQLLAQDAINDVNETGEPVRLAPMNPFERKIVHDAVKAAGLFSESEGEEPRRRVIVQPAK